MTPFLDYCARVQERIENVYGIHVVTTDVPDPFTGDLNGTEIQIDSALTPEQRLFLLLHLFGHTVQWNVNPRSLDIGRPRIPPGRQLRPDPDARKRHTRAGTMALRLFSLRYGLSGALLSHRRKARILELLAGPQSVIAA